MNNIQNDKHLKLGNKIIFRIKIYYICFKTTGCGSDVPNYIGDGYCDDENNNEGCTFDGGDCCLDVVNADYCTECLCYEDL